MTQNLSEKCDVHTEPTDNYTVFWCNKSGERLETDCTITNRGLRGALQGLRCLWELQSNCNVCPDQVSARDASRDLIKKGLI